MKNNEFYAVCERAVDSIFTSVIFKDYRKAELAYFKTLEEAEEFLRNLELYQKGKTIFKIGVNFSSKTRCIDSWKLS